jgi:all-trans-retinol dehydrogenase (NAD+)
MIRCLMLIAACIALHRAGPSLLNLGDRLPLTWTQTETLQWYLQWSLALWAVYDFNSMLNRWAENRWSFQNDKSAWNWEKEIAVVTGGSQGIGACVVKKLAFHGINCAVLDVAPLSETFTTGVILLIDAAQVDGWLTLRR